MRASVEVTRPLPGAAFGAVARLARPLAAGMPDGLPQLLAEAGGLLLIPGAGEVGRTPELLVQLSRLFGPEVEDYRFLPTGRAMVHETQPEIFLVTNTVAGARPPPARPEPPLTADGLLPVQYPHRKGWHTDQSYRRPPPDISLFYAVMPADRSRGQTLFASGILAYEALPARLKERVETLQGLHARPGTGRGRKDALAGKLPGPFAPHERSQPQPVVRVHPVTGQRALYLCEYGQMDWFEGPFVGMQAGPHGDGAALLDELMSHYTRPEFVYVHEWTAGDLLVWDNRCLIHAATWYDADREQRLMWRTTVRGNPGALYAGERRSWIPQEAASA
ncbi:TauD/TfdA family dioxygenase [Enhydrobacter sp.]|jgi:taurine dioxygenase|uniref:TauD/TfdA dioxygenase family protein n=1 Tax=Enhydrobacter sp. TaxID=1894999 RepID=UPI00262085BB|nr:TauD/TfdA family dioxygenase [Enhydrobacter sp.]WIM13138.1 MAG: Alpha-ketoglutarate-dependent taurine dioxygenase [Enhydrobacter sp.]